VTGVGVKPCPNFSRRGERQMIKRVKIGIYAGDLYTDDPINEYGDFAVLISFPKAGFVGFGQTREEAEGHLLALMKETTDKGVKFL
jgi:hypothetical protein